MQAIYQYLENNLFSTAIAIVGILIGVWSIYETKRHKGPKLVYQVIGQRVIRRFHSLIPSDKIDVLFQGTKVTSLSITQIILWNNGSNPARREDIAQGSPLKFSFGERAQIFTSEIVKTTSESNNFTANPVSANEITVEFDFVEQNDGVLISILHDDDKTLPRVNGKVIGQNGSIRFLGRFYAMNRNIVPQGERESILEYFVYITYSLINKFDDLFMAIFSAIGVSFIGTALYLKYVGKIMDATENPFFFFGTVILVYSIMLYAANRRRFPRALLPDEYSPTNIKRPA